MSDTFVFMAEIPAQAPAGTEVGNSELPPVLREIERVAGFKAAMRLVNKIGGLSVTIPKEPDPSHVLTQAVGLETARKISALFGGERIAVPRAHHYRTVLRQAEVCRRYRAGEPVRTLAKEYSLTERAVEKMVARENLRRQRRRYSRLMKEKK
jgi:hypothetical protein